MFVCVTNGSGFDDTSRKRFRRENYRRKIWGHIAYLFDFAGTPSTYVYAIPCTRVCCSVFPAMNPPLPLREAMFQTFWGVIIFFYFSEEIQSKSKKSAILIYPSSKKKKPLEIPARVNGFNTGLPGQWKSYAP